MPETAHDPVLAAHVVGADGLRSEGRPPENELAAAGAYQIREIGGAPWKLGDCFYLAPFGHDVAQVCLEAVPRQFLPRSRVGRLVGDLPHPWSFLALARSMRRATAILWTSSGPS